MTERPAMTPERKADHRKRAERWLETGVPLARHILECLDEIDRLEQQVTEARRDQMERDCKLIMDRVFTLSNAAARLFGVKVIPSAMQKRAIKELKDTCNAIRRAFEEQSK